MPRFRKPFRKTRSKWKKGADAEMLRENEVDPQSGESGSMKYKDDIDGA